MARKKAAGAEYDFSLNTASPRQKKRLVVHRRTRSFPYLYLFTGLVILSCLFATALAHTFVKARLSYLNWELDQVKMENAILMKTLEKKKLEIAGAKSLEKIKAYAIHDLGMIEHPQIEYLALHNFLTDEKTESIFELETAAGHLAEGELRKNIFRTLYDVVALHGSFLRGE